MDISVVKNYTILTLASFHKGPQAPLHVGTVFKRGSVQGNSL